MGPSWSQFFPPHPVLTEANLPHQHGKIFIVTGGYSGVGLQLAKILYDAGGKVYIAGRSEDKFKAAVQEIETDTAATEPKGQLEFLHLELDDLSSIKSSVDDFKRRERKLDVLWNNAGVSLPPSGSKGKSGHELMLVTNALGPFIFTKLLLPCLEAAAAERPAAAVRIVWTGSIVVDLQTPKGGFSTAELESEPRNQQLRYCHTKLGNWFLAREFGEQVKEQNILSIVQNPGNLKTKLLRHMPGFVGIIVSPLLYDAKYGAYTELYAGLSEELTMADSGGYIVPWGRVHPAPREDLLASLKSTEEGGTGMSRELWLYCEKEYSLITM